MTKIIRIDIFKSSGKWYETLNVEMEYDLHALTNIACQMTIESKTKYKIAENIMLDNWFAVILSPNHANSYPQVIWIE